MQLIFQTDMLGNHAGLRNSGSPLFHHGIGEKHTSPGNKQSRHSTGNNGNSKWRKHERSSGNSSSFFKHSNSRLLWITIFG